MLLKEFLPEDQLVILGQQARGCLQDIESGRLTQEQETRAMEIIEETRQEALDMITADSKLQTFMMEGRLLEEVERGEAVHNLTMLEYYSRLETEMLLPG